MSAERIRGLRVFAAWLNHDDSRSVNSQDALAENGSITMPIQKIARSTLDGSPTSVSEKSYGSGVRLWKK